MTDEEVVRAAVPNLEINSDVEGIYLWDATPGLPSRIASLHLGYTATLEEAFARSRQHPTVKAYEAAQAGERVEDEFRAETTECRSEDGITIGLLDTIMTAAHALKGRSLSSIAVVEAMKDFYCDPELRVLLVKASGLDYTKVRTAYELNALEGLMEPK